MACQSNVSMEVETCPWGQGQSFPKEGTHRKIKVLMVDDDSTTLNIASTILRSLNYEVLAVPSAMDALSALQFKRDEFDLVLTDHHMPGMQGLELQKRVLDEFEIPVIMMSADERESLIRKSLECGAAFFIVKPIKPDDLKNIWQIAVAVKKGKYVMNLEESGIITGGCALSTEESLSLEKIVSVESLNEEKWDEARARL